MPETRTVTFFLSFPDAVRAERARALLGADGFAALDLVPPDSGADPAWSLAAEGELGRADLDRAVARVRAIAAATGGTLEGTALPWPEQAGA